MVSSRNAWLAAMLVGSLAGCSEMRWHRRSSPAKHDPTPANAQDQRAPSKELPATETSAYAPPNYLPALFIPGSADSPATSRSPDRLPSPSEASSATETTLPPLTPTAPAVSDQPLRALERKAALKWTSLDAYGCRLRRREVVGGQQKPEEIIDAHFRREPFSVYFKWTGLEAKGREVIYVHGQHGNQIHTLTAAGDVPLLPGGAHFKVAPDSLLVRNKGRYPITEAGVGSLIDRFSKLVDAVERGDARAGAVKYLGQIKRKEFENKVEVVLQTILPGWEPQLPGGGQRVWCFDPEHGLPMLIVTHDQANREVEFYCHDQFEFPGRYGDDDFNPERRWAKRGARPASE